MESFRERSQSLKKLFYIMMIASSIVNLAQNLHDTNASTLSVPVAPNVSRTITLKVLLVEFKDVKHRNPQYPIGQNLPAYTTEDFENLFFSENVYVSPNMYSPDGDQVFGSMKDYYRIMSYNNLDITGSILNRDINNDGIPEWISLDSTKSFYHNLNFDLFNNESLAKASSQGLDVSTGSDTYLVIIYAGHTYRNSASSQKSLNPKANFSTKIYVMGERFAAYAPYETERDHADESTFSKFAHIGIHAHEFAHLLGCSDHYGNSYNQEWDLLSYGCYNGPYRAGSCPAPLNPYDRFNLKWIDYRKINSSRTVYPEYSLRDPDIYQLRCDNIDKEYFLVEYRNFNSKMKLGQFETRDYNSFIKNLTLEEGILVWRYDKNNAVKLIHANGYGLDDLNKDAHIFPGDDNVRVLTPWSDSREIGYENYWLPNTKNILDRNNCGMEIISDEPGNFIVDLYEWNPKQTSPSKPKNLRNASSGSINIEWEENTEPDLRSYNIYKKKNDSEYALFETVFSNELTDNSEILDSASTNHDYAYYYVTANDSEGKESTPSRIIKVAVASNSITAVEPQSGIDPAVEFSFKLSQNYPNPFNPSTTINYTIPNVERNGISLKSSERFTPPTGGLYNITLIVYDALGREVAVLVNEQQPAGSYEVEFSAKELSSGVYFYKLRAGEFVSTKKMLLLR